LSKEHPVLDVRSPSEFLHAHIPSAYNLPLFNNEERKIVGTIYKQQSRQQAIKTGLDYFGVKMRGMVEEVEGLIIDHKRLAEKMFQMANDQLPTNIVLVHCWRGGMRSAALAWLLDLYGYKVYALSGGYKAFRNWVLQQFDKRYHFKILGGYTGSGKTGLIEELQRLGKPVLNLEALANHKGSAFGALGERPQPTQEMFENRLALELSVKASPSAGGDHDLDGRDLEGALWLEDESQRIGALNIPKIFWEEMRNSPLYFIDIPFEERLNHLVVTYGTFSKVELVNAITRIQKRLGGLEAKNAVNFLEENKIPECFEILLRYYDKCYTKGLHSRTNLKSICYKIPCATVNANNIAFLPSLIDEEGVFSPAFANNNT
jgi:tRNA 2-selenouridine synthase